LRTRLIGNTEIAAMRLCGRYNGQGGPGRYSSSYCLRCEVFCASFKIVMQRGHW
jgi:hypothetical protein